jgi:hypothetical protein
MADFCNSCVDSWQGGPDGGHGMRPRGRANPRSAAFGNSHDMTPASFVVDGPWCAEQRGMSRVTGYVVGVGADTLAGQCVPVPASGLCLGRCFSGLKAERRLQASAPRENKVSNAGPMPSRLHMLAGLGRDARCEMRYGYATCNMLHATCAPPVRASLAVEVASKAACTASANAPITAAPSPSGSRRPASAASVLHGSRCHSRTCHLRAASMRIVSGRIVI